ncbi:hypothetical protein ACFRAU_24525 [Arthrobacter sp. NPDC056691]|uniref:hypothetical protein n=1 Tax=Arthrobacter sp. NPDC056691 TaxID=3345913 RepID=UPI003671679B
MEALKRVVRNEYFPAAAVLALVVLFWVAGLFGGLSLLSRSQPPIATLTWLLFVYAAAVLTPLAGVLAAADLLRRWWRNRRAAKAGAPNGGTAQDGTAQDGARIGS